MDLVKVAITRAGVDVDHCDARPVHITLQRGRWSQILQMTYGEATALSDALYRVRQGAERSGEVVRELGELSKVQS